MLEKAPKADERWEKMGGLDVLEDLQNHPIMEIYELSNEILGKFFSIEDLDKPKETEMRVEN